MSEVEITDDHHYSKLVCPIEDSRKSIQIVGRKETSDSNAELCHD
jgi:hypothetical protein